ncbi:hypothetical protein AAG906_034960 [Vitis piasezkii]|uniref:Uncharacterized protein n=1 Tax=Vitis vinifera TaxID=29760 RepID=A0A438IXW8_VITVI|nr:hypothetical protein CK203_017499 [Vitis vinifera]
MASPQEARPRTNGKLTTILSIDGRGVRSIVPRVILSALEAQLQVFSRHSIFLFTLRVWGIGGKAARGAQSSEALLVSPHIWKFKLFHILGNNLG